MYKKLLPFALACIFMAPTAFAIDQTTGDNPGIAQPSTDSICFFNDAAFVLRVCDFDFGGCTDLVGGQNLKINISSHLNKYGVAHFIIMGILVHETPLNISLRRTGDTVHVLGDAWFSKLLVGLDAGACK